MTGLTPKEAAEAHAELEKEGVFAPAPTREEVDDFLEKQIFRVRHEPDLTEKKRESIINRLKAGIGRLLPSGSKFHAWKNLVAESWSRVRRKAATAFVVGALSFGVVGCGNAPDTAKEPVQAENVAVANYDTTWDEAEPSIEPAAVRKYGQKNVDAAIESSEALLREYAYNDDLILADSATNEAKLSALGKQMSPNARRDWEGGLKTLASNRTDFDAQKKVFSLALADLYPTNDTFTHDGVTEPLQAPKSGPASINPVLSDTKVRVIEDGRLEVSTRVEADLRVTHNGQAKLWHFNKGNTFWLNKTSDGWKIDGWEAEFKASPELTVEK